MNPTIHVEELARQVRGSTLDLLGAARESWLTWAPEGTSNHILWHAGHALWLQDTLCVRPLTGQSELPHGWSETFGSRCRPVRTTTLWPARTEVRKLLAAQLDRMLALFRTESDRLDGIGPNTSMGWDLTRGVIHGLHDEARHQGEMYLLLKLCRTRSV
jgi:hypothetical protein